MLPLMTKIRDAKPHEAAVHPRPALRRTATACGGCATAVSAVAAEHGSQSRGTPVGRHGVAHAEASVCGVILLVLALAGPSQATIRRVKAGAAGGGSGSDWTNAYGDLQAALEASTVGDEIWVAAGTYMPDGGSKDRLATFSLKSGVAVYGGFAGTEGDRDERDPVANVTTLSGDLGGDDAPGFANNGENSYHVVTASGADAAAVLDGFVIAGGNSNGPAPHDHGGGIFNSGGNPTVSHCLVTGNFAVYGGSGMYNLSGRPTVTDCIFSNNAGQFGSGAGMDNESSSDATVTRCIFRDNSLPNGYGGGMQNDGSHPTVTECLFSNNSAGQGGGMFNSSSNPVLVDCEFSGNSSGDGGGMGNWTSNPAMTNCVFRDNAASANGGGMSNDFSSNPTLVNCLFWNNRAHEDGGAIFFDVSAAGTLTNCTIAGNSAARGGGLAFGSFAEPAAVTNCILWGNAGQTAGPQQIYSEMVFDATPSVKFTCIQDGWTGAGGDGNVIDDPRFVDAAGGDLHLAADSPCIDAADSAALPTAMTGDLDGQPRLLDDPLTVDTGAGPSTYLDMGAYEYRLSTPTPTPTQTPAAGSSPTAAAVESPTPGATGVPQPTPTKASSPIPGGFCPASSVGLAGLAAFVLLCLARSGGRRRGDIASS